MFITFYAKKLALSFRIQKFSVQVPDAPFQFSYKTVVESNNLLNINVQRCACKFSLLSTKRTAANVLFETRFFLASRAVT